MNLKKIFLILLFFLLNEKIKLLSQNIKTFNNNVTPILTDQGNNHQLFKFSFVFGISKGFSIGLSYGVWHESPWLQYSLNSSLQWRFGKKFLGNFYDGANLNDSRSKSQLIFAFSPMLTTKLANGDHVYQELESFYLGTPNAVFNKYSYSLTLGTTFTISPRGTYKNISTSRNRTQQDFMLGVNIKNFNFTLYDDYFPLFTDIIQLGDNWDRYFTGGGFVRYRFNDQYTLHIYSEVYTGINKTISFLNPDLITYKYRKGKWKRKNYANQNAGQEFFNSSWLIAKLTYSGPAVSPAANGWHTPGIDIIVGSSAPWTMFSQNFIHSKIPHDKTNCLKLHYFMHRTNVPGNLQGGGRSKLWWNVNSLFLGGGFHSNILLH